jgi:RND family efflux transporter MFP subunit
MRRLIVGIVVLVCVGAAAAYWFSSRHTTSNAQLTLYGNLDLRQVSLAFNESERVASVLVEEGERVHKEQVLARLDTSRLAPEVDVAAATVEVDKVNAENASRQYDRAKRLFDASHGGAISQADLDNAQAAYDGAVAHQHADEAQLELLQQQLADAVLTAPVDATVQTRILEPGDMASPQTPAFLLAVTDPKWVRAYVSEEDLAKVHPGMKAIVSVDGLPGRQFDGWIGFISPVAEFTPKTVETAELRTSLVYETRVMVKDPSDDLRLGMPATVVVPLNQSKAPPSEGAPVAQDP